MRHVEPREKKYFLVFFDFESETHTEVKLNPLAIKNTFDDDDDEDGKKGTVRLHRVNCVSAMYFCHECCKYALDGVGISSESNSNECKSGLCQASETGERRMKTWINGVDGCADALRWFLIWLLNGLPGGNMRSYTTYVVGHYCGRSVFPQTYMTENNKLILDMICICCCLRFIE